METWSGRNGPKKPSANAVRTVLKWPNRRILAVVAVHSESPIAKRNLEVVRMIIAFRLWVFVHECPYLISSTARGGQIISEANIGGNTRNCVFLLWNCPIRVPAFDAIVRYSSLFPRFTTAGRCNSKVSPMLAVYQSVSKKECRILRSSMDGGYPEVHLRLPLALLERHTTATAESTNNINTSRSAALPAARLP